MDGPVSHHFASCLVQHPDIAICKKKIVATGRTISDVYKTVKELKIKNPLVTYIPKEGEEALLIWLDSHIDDGEGNIVHWLLQQVYISIVIYII